MKICLASNNPNKLKEIRHTLGPAYEVLSLADIGHTGELPEHQKTLEGNSLEKAEFIHKKYGIDCISDDTGLEVVALDGAPGVYSSRYAGPDCSPKDNMDLLLKNMEGKDDRRAQFRTVVTLIRNKRTRQFEGLVQGSILRELRGSEGFGYDPIFVPKGYDVSFAEMSLEEKNKISHRGLAVKKLCEFLQKKKIFGYQASLDEMAKFKIKCKK